MYYMYYSFGVIGNRHPPDNQTLFGLYPIKKGVINSYPTHKRLIKKSYPNCIHICYLGGADSLLEGFQLKYESIHLNI